MVCEFHTAAGGQVPLSVVESVAAEQAELRRRILDEEVDELRAAVSKNDVVSIADALADIVYVAYGTAVTYGIPLDSVFAEVHRSNMTKIGPDGPYLRADGKITKGPDYEPPDIAGCLTWDLSSQERPHGLHRLADRSCVAHDVKRLPERGGIVY
jgi:predicted HAD superfamily Cof-like phosphohydrolase